MLKLRQNVVWREFEEGAVLLDLGTSRYLSTNASATVLWQRLEQGTTRDELVQALVDAFEDVDAKRAGADVDAFLADAQERGLLEPGLK